MAIYSIRDLEKLTGIKAHTIRMWEQRYHLVAPARTDTNIRYYTDENLRHLFNVALLNRYGYKISKLAKMQPQEIAARVAEIAESNGSANSQVDALTLAMIDLDEIAFDRIFSTYAWEHGFEKTMLELVYPFLDKLNVLWLTHSVSPAHEKFITNLIRRKLMCAIDKEPSDSQREGAKFLLYLPEGESQELTLLFMHYLLRSRRQKVVYLGPHTSLADLRDACQPFRPDYVFTILQEPLARQSVQSYLDNAAQSITTGRLLLSGAQLFVNPIKLPSNAQVLGGLPDALQFLDRLVIEQRGNGH
ncbi:MAG: MerR family transcriptional regulator [Thermoanaerobaculia bacterium]|nr:MerR family transcriptional regulator [Thermoanaerobaculia bacterium]